MGRLLYLIELGTHEGTPTIVSPQHCTAIVKVMLRQTDRDAIPAALPPHVAVANKTGEIEGTRNDIAIVEPFGESPLILAIMTKDAYDYGASYAAIHAVTRAVYASAVGTRRHDAPVDDAAAQRGEFGTALQALEARFLRLCQREGRRVPPSR